MTDIKFKILTKKGTPITASLGEDGKRRLFGIASSTIRDLHGDTMEETAVDDMVASLSSGLTVFGNHSYTVPEDVYGWSEQARKSKTAEIDPETGDTLVDLPMGLVINDDNDRAIKSWTSVKGGAKLGLSIGAQIPEGGAVRRKDGTYSISHVNLLEVSIVGIPANPRSWIQNAMVAIKTATAEGSDDLAAYIAQENTDALGAAIAAVEASDTPLVEPVVEPVVEDVIEPVVEPDVTDAAHTHGHAHSHEHEHQHGWEGGADYVVHSHDHAHRHGHEHDNRHHEADDDKNTYDHDHWHAGAAEDDHPHNTKGVAVLPGPDDVPLTDDIEPVEDTPPVTAGVVPLVTGRITYSQKGVSKEIVVGPAIEAEARSMADDWLKILNAIPTVQDAKVWITIDTEDTAANGNATESGSPQGASSEPDTGDGLADETADGDNAALGDDVTRAITNSVGSLTTHLGDLATRLVSVTEELTVEKAARIRAESERDQIAAAATEVVRGCKTVIEKIAATPVGRRTSFVSMTDDFDEKYGGIYTEGFLKMLKAPSARGN